MGLGMYVLMMVALLSAAQGASEPQVPVVGDPGYLHRGKAMAVVGDVDADGYDDVVIGGQFRFDLYPGGPLGPSTDPTCTALVGLVDQEEYAADLLTGGDWNDDGHADVAWTVIDEATEAPRVEVRYGSTGCWSTEADEVFPGATGIATGDIDGNGVDDLVVGYPDANGGAGWVTVVPGDASGLSASVFGASGISGRAGEEVAVGDVDGDGYDDVIVRPYGSPDRFDVYLGSASALTYSASYGDPTMPDFLRDWDHVGRTFAVSDVDGDGYDDVVLLHGAVFRGGPSGPSALPDGQVSGAHLTASVVGEGEDVASVGDIDGDGLDEVAFGLWDELRLLRGHPSALRSRVFSDPVWSGHQSVAGGDVNGDGYSDLLYSNAFAGHVNLRFGGPSRLGGPPVHWPAQVIGVLGYELEPLGDVDGDGFEDLAICEGSAYGQSVTRVYGGSATGLASEPFATFLGAKSAGVGDADGDGIRELAFVNEVDAGVYELHVHYGADGLVGAPQILETFGGAKSGVAPLFGDADGDGYEDLATVLSVAGAPASTVLYRGGPAGLSTVPTMVSDQTDLEPLTWADVDGDGFEDLIVLREQGADVIVGVIPGSAAGLGTPVEVDRYAAALPGLSPSMASGDWNGDGYDDVAVLGFTDGDDAIVWFGSATGLDAGSTGGLTGLPAHTIKKANRRDVTGDGIDDLVLGDTFGAGQVLLYEGGATGFGATAPQVLASMPDEQFGAGVAFLDVDGDGGLELSVLSLMGLNTAGRLHVLPFQP